jgi:hypothetical protein
MSKFKRKPPPFAIRCVFAAMMYGIAAPLLWTLQKLGRADRFFRGMGAGRQRRLAKNNPFAGYTPSSHDVFVATFAKSGTNWMMQIVHQLLFHGQGEYDHIHDVVPWPDTKAMGPMSAYAVPLEDPSVWIASPEHKRVIKTHFDWELIPYSEDARYILVIRDPKDVFVSSYFFFVKNGPLRPLMLSVDLWFRLFVSDHFPIGGSWVTNTAGYWAQRHRPNVLVVSFKSMKRDLRGTVLRVAQLLNLHLSDAVLDDVCRKSSFEYMKQIDQKFQFWKMTPWGSPTSMMRSGRQGGSSELLTPERQRELDAYCMAALKRLGSDFPYEEFCEVSPGAETAPALAEAHPAR